MKFSLPNGFGDKEFNPTTKNLKILKQDLVKIEHEESVSVEAVLNHICKNLTWEEILEIGEDPAYFISRTDPDSYIASGIINHIDINDLNKKKKKKKNAILVALLDPKLWDDKAKQIELEEEIKSIY